MNLDEPDRQRGPLVRRRWALAAVVLGAAAAAAFGVASPLWVKSPQQVAAEAAPPSPSVLTAPVEQRVVSQTIVLRGAVASQDVREVTPVSAQDGALPVVTDVRVRPGDEIVAGEVVLEVSGRPLIVLPGKVPAYRDLRPGTVGEDVAQLQEALQNLGYGSAEPDGDFGPGTKEAVEAMYEALGYAAPTTGEGDEAAVEAAANEITQLERRVEDARHMVEEAATDEEKERARIEVDRAEEDLGVARDRLDRLRRRTGPMVPMSEFVFLPSFPAQLYALNAKVGSQVEAPLITLASGALVIESQASQAQGELLRPDMPVEIVLDADDSVPGRITAIGELSSGNDDGIPAAPGHKVVITPDERLDARLAGQGARLVIEAASSEGDVLAVPVSALFAAVDGRLYVRRLVSLGEEAMVYVTPELSGDGYVAIRVLDGELRPGDLVVVGAGAIRATSGDGP